MIDNILVDMDNTLVDWTKGMEDGLYNWLGFRVTVKFLDRWVPAKIRKAMFAEVYSREVNFWKNLEYIPNLTPVIMHTLKESQNLTNPPKIWICTHLSDIDDVSAERWGKQLSAKKLFHIHNVKIAGIIYVPRSTDKVDMFPPGNCMLIDDYYKNIEAARVKGHDVIQVNRFRDYSEGATSIMVNAQVALIPNE